MKSHFIAFLLVAVIWQQRAIGATSTTLFVSPTISLYISYDPDSAPYKVEVAGDGPGVDINYFSAAAEMMFAGDRRPTVTDVGIFTEPAKNAIVAEFPPHISFYDNRFTFDPATQLSEAKLPPSLDQSLFPTLSSSLNRFVVDGYHFPLQTSSPADVIKANLPKPQVADDGSGIVASFKPAVDGIPINPRLLAHAAGYDRFEWVSTIVHLPEAIKPVLDAKLNKLQEPFFDPPPGGYNAPDLQGRYHISDNQPYYWDVESYPSQYPEDNHAMWENDKALVFGDSPVQPTANSSEPMEFITELVGVLPDDDATNAMPGMSSSEHWVPITGFSWLSTVNGSIGSVVLSRPPGSLPPSDVSGGVTILNPSLQMGDIPESVLRLWTTSGAVLVPEPASISFLAIAAVLLFNFRRRFAAT